MTMERSTYDEIADAEDHHWWYVERRAIIRQLLDMTAFDRGGHVLEVGCGSGGNIALLSDYGAVSATEMDDLARETAIARHGSRARIVYGRAPDQLGFPGEKFDLIGMFDVLEHIEDDRAALATLAGMLTSGGKIILTCPAYQWLWSLHDERAHHFRRYTMSGLLALGRSVGLMPVRATYFNSILLPPIAAVRIWSRLFPTKTDIGMKTPRPVLNALLTSTFRAEAALVRSVRLPAGVSVATIFALP